MEGQLKSHIVTWSITMQLGYRLTCDAPKVQLIRVQSSFPNLKVNTDSKAVRDHLQLMYRFNRAGHVALPVLDYEQWTPAVSLTKLIYVLQQHSLYPKTQLNNVEEII